MFLMFVGFINIGYPQQTFFTQISDGNIHSPWDILIKPDGNILFCSSYYRSSVKSWSSIWEVDQTGEIINEWTFTNTSDEFLSATRMLEVDNQIFLFGAGQRNQTDSIEKFVSMRKFDMQLNELEDHQLHLTGMQHQSLWPMRIIYKDLIFHIITIIAYGPGSSSATAGYFKTSTTGTNIQSAFLPPSSGYRLRPYDFCFLPGSDNLFTATLDELTIYNTGGVIIEFDTSMNIIEQIPLDSYPAFLDFGIFGQADTTYYAMFNFFAFFGDISPGIEKRDLHGNILNQFVYECPEDSASWIAYRNALDTLPDGNLMFCATKNIDFYSGIQQEPTSIMLFKLSRDLELIWQRFIFGDNGNYRVWSMKAHPDGGIVVLGTLSRTPPFSNAEEVFIMKTDSIGLVTGINENEAKIHCAEAILYPNPASEFVNIEFSQVYQKALFQLMDVGGKVIFEKKLFGNHQSINVSSVPAGTYVYRIFNEEGLDERGKVVVE